MKLFWRSIGLIVLALLPAIQTHSATAECPFDRAGVNIQSIRKNPNVRHFNVVKSGQLYAGVLRSGAVFQLQQFTCTSSGAEVNLLMPPASMGTQAQLVDMAMQAAQLALPAPMFRVVAPELKAQLLDQPESSEPQFFPALSDKAGVASLELQVTKAGNSVWFRFRWVQN